MIVDASVVVKWFVPEVLREQARALLRDDVALLAPDLVVVEVANALWLKAGRGELDERDALRAIAAVGDAKTPELRSSVRLVPRAFEWSRRLEHPVYDCVYLALAEELDMPLTTADQRFVTAAAGPTAGRVQLLGT